MKKGILVLTCMILISSIVLYAKPEPLKPRMESSLSSKNVIHDNREKTVIFLSITNTSKEAFMAPGYSYLAELFVIKNPATGKRFPDSQWVSNLRRKKRWDPGIKVGPKSTVHIMYFLDQLVKPGKAEKAVVTCGPGLGKVAPLTVTF